MSIHIARNIVVCFISIFFFSCQSIDTNNSSSEGKEITIIYNNDVFAYLEPCGCRVDPIGGMHRRWNATQAFPKDSRISVDAGNLFFVTKNPAEYMREQLKEQAHTVVEAYNLLGWDVFSPGENDFALGVEELKKLEKKAKFSFISSNIFYKKSNKPIFAENIVLKRHGKKIGIFALFSPDLTIPEELVVRNPVEIAKDQITKLKKERVDLIIALSSQGLEADQKLAESVDGIHVIVGGYSQSFLQNPITIRETTIVQLSSKNQVFGYLNYSLGTNKFVRGDAKVLDLDAKYDTNSSSSPNPMKGLVAIMNMKINEINKNQSLDVWQKHKELTPDFSTYKSCEKCHNQQAEFQQRHPHAAAFLTLVRHGKENNLDCLKCHSVGMGAQGGFLTPADAIRNKFGESIGYQKILKQAGLNNIIGSKISYRKNEKQRMRDVQRWEDALTKANVKTNFLGVQCENCHGSRPNHPFTDFEAAKKISAVSCMQCHTKEQIPEWYDKNGKPLEAIFDANIKKVACPKSL